MKVILVDDELLALTHLERLIGNIDGYEIIGKYTNPNEALEAIFQDQPDVVFLDINMPRMSGIELAETIQSAQLKVHIVFVTAFDEYAVKAFELNAVDYIMKPINHERLLATCSRFNKQKQSTVIPSLGQQFICCFRTLQFMRIGEQRENIEVHWRTFKARELFAYLLQHRMKPVRKDVLLELFWPESDLEKGYAQLYAAIYQIRKTLASINFNVTITSYENSYLLDLNEVKFDVEEWERKVQYVFLAKDKMVSAHQHIIQLYQGDYLIEDGYLWAENERERFRVLFLQYTKIMTEQLIPTGNYIEAIKLHQKVQMMYPYKEESYFMLMKLYDLLGDRKLVENQYDKLIEMLKEEYDVAPAATIQRWYDSWKKGESSQLKRNKDGIPEL